MRDGRAAMYGDRHARVYDRLYGSRFAPDTAVDALAGFTVDGGLLEMGIGTGRLAIPLAARGVAVDGIEGSAKMIEAFRPDPTRFDTDGCRVETRETGDGSTHLARSWHDPARQCIHVTHVLSGGSDPGEYTVELCYATQVQLDAMASVAGLELTARWHDWSGEPATEDSRDPISVYRQTQEMTVTG
jgi:hypothetical protein